MTRYCAIFAFLVVMLSDSHAVVRQANGKRLSKPTVKLEDLGTWKPHGDLSALEKFWAFPSGNIAYTLRSARDQGSGDWCRVGVRGVQRDIWPGEGNSNAEIHAANRAGDIVFRTYSAADDGKPDIVYLRHGDDDLVLPNPPGFVHSWPRVVNAKDVVAGTALTKTDSDDWHGCMWVNGKPMLIPDVNGKGVTPRSINDKGEILVIHQTNSKSRPGYAVYNGTDMRPVKNGGWGRMWLRVINNRGDIAGVGAKTDTDDPEKVRLILIQNEQVKDLGQIPGSVLEIRDMDSRNSIVGIARSADQADNVRAFMWDTKHGIRELNSLLPKKSRWHLREAHGIDANGAIFGAGTFDGKPRFFRMTLPNN